MPQSPQNFLLAGFSLPQLEQRIGSPIDYDWQFIYHPAGATTTVWYRDESELRQL